jgi:2-hydroxychromene-2-carboxylate isomerase
MPESIDLGVKIPGERIIELVLEIVLVAMQGQSVEQRKQMWDWHIEDVKRWRKLVGLDDTGGPHA